MGYPIRYTRTDDAVNIAFTELGTGEPLIYLTSFPWSNFAFGFSDPLLCSHAEEVAEGARLIVYDGRGTGLSDHDAQDLSLDGLARDVDAVARAAGVERFALYGSAESTRVMIRYAATRPERVTKLVLWLPSISNRRLHEADLMQNTRSLARTNWDLYCQLCSYGVVGGWDPDKAHSAAAWARMMAAAMRPEEFPRIADALRQHDVTGDLARVQAPTLVIARENAAVYTPQLAGEVAAGIPDSRMVVAPGTWLLPCTDTIVSGAIVDFMQDPPPERHAFPVREPAAQGRLSTREREVLQLISQGKTNAEIADTLVVSHATAARHVHNILNKLGVSRRAEAAVLAATGAVDMHLVP